MRNRMKVKLIYALVLLTVLLCTVNAFSQDVACPPDFSVIKTFIEQGKLEQAAGKLSKVLAVNPESGEAHLLLGHIYRKKAKILQQKAISEYEKALEDERTHLLALKELAKIWLEEEKYERVIDALSRTKKEEQDFEVLKLLGLAYFKSGHSTEALKELEEARKIKADDVETLFFLGQIYEDKKLFEEALSSYQKIISLAPKGKLSRIVQERIQSIEQERLALTVKDIKDPEIRQIILTAPEARDYPQAGAIILLNEHECLVKKDNTLEEKIHRLVKIFNVRGREKYGEVQIDYDSTYQTVKVDYARVIKPDGRMIKVGKKDIKDVDRWSGFPLYSNAKVKIISMPEVIEDSIIEYSATIITNKLINEDDFQFCFGIQGFEPCLRHRFKLTIPKGRKVNIHYVRLKDVEPQVSEDRGWITYKWEINDVPEIIAEPNMPSWADISPFIMVSSFASWQEFSQWWRKLSEGQAEPTPQIIQKVEELVRGKDTDEEKARTIYHWVTSKIRYVGLEFGIAGFRPHRAEEIFKNKYGDCKDKATLLIAMYKAAGIPAYYALIGTREMGKLEKEIPMSQFNHAIVLARVNGKFVWLDPTAEIVSYGNIPGSDQEKEALVFFEDEARFLKVPLQAPEENKMEIRMVIDINPDGSIDVEMELTSLGASDMEMRSFRYIKPEQRKQVIQNWINSIAPGAKLKSYQFSDLEDLDTSVKLKVAYSATDYLKRAGNLWMFSIPGIEEEAGIVGKEKRNYPILFYTTSMSVYKVEIHLPPELEVEYLPEPVLLEKPYGSFKSSYRASGKNIFYEGISKRKQTLISLSQYPDYKLFKEKVARESQRQIIIKGPTLSRGIGKYKHLFNKGGSSEALRGDVSPLKPRFSVWTCSLVSSCPFYLLHKLSCLPGQYLKSSFS